MHFFSLSLSFPVRGAGHRPNPFQEVPEASWVRVEHFFLAVGTPILGEQARRRGSAMVPLDRKLVSSYRLS